MIIDDNKNVDKLLQDQQKMKELLTDPWMKNYLSRKSGLGNTSTISAEIAVANATSVGEGGALGVDTNPFSVRNRSI